MKPPHSLSSKDKRVEIVAVAILRANGRSVDADGHARDFIKGEVMAESYHARDVARKVLAALDASVGRC